MNPSEHNPVPAKRSNGAAEPETEAELIARLDQRRNELLQAAGVLRTPLRTVNRADEVVRRVLPILPYALTAITVIGVTTSIIRGRRVRPTVLLATGLDLWRLWKNFKDDPSRTSMAAVRSLRAPQGEQTK